jgi:hypothetical protein
MGYINPVVHSSATYRRSVADAVGGYPDDFPYAQDFALWLAILQRGDIAILPEQLADIRVLPTSMTRGSKGRVEAAWDRVVLFEQAARQLRLSSAAKSANRRSWARSAIQYGIALMANRRLIDGLRWISRGVVRSPWALVDNNVARRSIGVGPRYWWN